MKYDNDDPKLTAYVLGELDDNERMEVEKLLESNAEARSAVDGIRETAELLKTELAREPALCLSNDQRQAIAMKAAAVNGRVGTSPLRTGTFWRRYRRPMALAASIVFVVGTISIMISSVQRTRVSARRQLAMSNIKSIGMSVKVYQDDDPNGWGVPVHSQGESVVVANDDDGVKGLIPAAGNGVLTANSQQSQPTSYEIVGDTMRLADSNNAAVLESLGYIANATSSADASTDPSASQKITWRRIQSAPVSNPAGTVGSHGGRGGRGGSNVSFADGHATFSFDTDAASTQMSVSRAFWTLVGSGDVTVKQFVSPSSAEHADLTDNVERFNDFLDYNIISYGYQESFGVRGGLLENSGPFYIEQEQYSAISTNPFLLVTEKPLSTFSIDVDTASYANIRRFLTGGSLPPRDAVRIEEMVNYFNYDYPLPTCDDPFSVNVEVADCPWDADHRLARIGIKGWKFEEVDRPPANLVFLIDVSGSMQQPNKLSLVKESLELLVGELADNDQVAMVVYAGASGLVLDSTPCKTKRTIFDALDRLQAGGGTNGGAGIQLAYEVADENFIEGGINRVILATDGDFNVGVTNRGELTELIEEKAKTGVFLSVLGFGMGNLKDATLETLADKGNGNYAYIDTLNEAQKVLIEQMGGTLITIAKDVKIQVEFNPFEVSAYRLIGYENRLLAARDFNDDTKDAGEIGAGHTVTAFYEIVPVGIEPNLPDIDPLKYQEFAGEPSEAAETGELMTVKLRYKQPDGDTSTLIEMPVVDQQWTLDDASDEFVFAASVASFGMLLRRSEYSGAFTYDDVLEMAETAVGEDAFGYRTEFLDLVHRAIEVDN